MKNKANLVTPIYLSLILILLNACSNSQVMFPSSLKFFGKNSYTQCSDPACYRTAREITPPPRVRAGTEFAMNNALDFVLSKEVRKVYQRDKKFIVEFKDNSKLASREVDIDKLELHDILITTYDFFQFVFLKNFQDLKDSDPSRGLLSSVKAWKYKVAEVDRPYYYTFGNSIAFCFQRNRVHRQIIVVNKSAPEKAIAIDLLGFSNAGFENVVASLSEFDR